MNRITFDPSEGPTAEQQQAETAALEQGELLANAAEEDRARLYAQTEAENEQPSLIGGKFKSQDELLKAYNELQKKLGANTPEEDEEATEEAPEEAPVEEEQPQEEPVEEVGEAVRYMEELGQVFNEKGNLDEEAVEKLAAMDSKELVQAYIQYAQRAASKQQQAVVEASTLNAIKDSVGGEKAYGEMVGWAAENLSAEEINDFNAVTASGNVAAIKFAVEALNNRYRGADGYEAPLITGKSSRDKGKVFRSQAELSRAIADPRYSTDPAYRQDVEEKLARSGDLL